MELQLSDLMGTDFTTIAIMFIVVGLGCLGWLTNCYLNGDSMVLSSVFSLVFVVSGIATYAVGKTDESNVKPYYDRLNAYYQTFEPESDFMFRKDLQELIRHGTVNGRNTDVANLGRNTAIDLIAKYFPYDDANVSDVAKLRDLRTRAVKCFVSGESVDYVRTLSELPVSVADFERIEKELSIIFGDSCDIPKQPS